MVRDRLLSAHPLTAVTRPAERTDASVRTSTGVAGLDRLIEGGFPANRAVLLCGGPGTGKTTFGLQFLHEGLERGEPGIFVSLDEKPRHLIDDAARQGLALEPALDAGALTVLDAAPYFTASRGKGWTRPGIDARQVAADLQQQVRKLAARRVVVDTMTTLVPPDMDGAHAHDYLRSLVQSLEDNLGCTLLITCRGRRDEPQATCRSLRYLASGVLELRLRHHDSALTRTLRLLKMRGTAFEPADYGVALDEEGLSVLERMGIPGVTRFTPRPRPVAAAAPQPSDHPAAV